MFSWTFLSFAKITWCRKIPQKSSHWAWNKFTSCSELTKECRNSQYEIANSNHFPLADGASVRDLVPLFRAINMVYMATIVSCKVFPIKILLLRQTKTFKLAMNFIDNRCELIIYNNLSLALLKLIFFPKNLDTFDFFSFLKSLSHVTSIIYRKGWVSTFLH